MYVVKISTLKVKKKKKKVGVVEIQKAGFILLVIVATILSGKYITYIILCVILFFE